MKFPAFNGVKTAKLFSFEFDKKLVFRQVLHHFWAQKRHLRSLLGQKNLISGCFWVKNVIFGHFCDIFAESPCTTERSLTCNISTNRCSRIWQVFWQCAEERKLLWLTSSEVFLLAWNRARCDLYGNASLKIYEARVGICTEQEKVSTYRDFKK